MDTIRYIIAILVGGALGAGALLAVQPAQVDTLGSITGPDVQSYLSVHGVFTQGGGVFATSSAGASTLSMASIARANLVERSGTGALTLTLPASTTITGLPHAGDMRSVYVFNLGSGSITMAGGSGTLLENASTTAIITNGIGRIDFIRKSNTDIEAFFTPGV